MNFVSVSLIVAAAGRSLPPESNVANAEFQLSLKALDIPCGPDVFPCPQPDAFSVGR